MKENYQKYTNQGNTQPLFPEKIRKNMPHHRVQIRLPHIGARAGEAA